uniref:Uncharacterized protein n=1 Tax=Romanomermis culicivorax TaxID=13658 RepID=A0A915JKU5_ROMCU
MVLFGASPPTSFFIILLLLLFLVSPVLFPIQVGPVTKYLAGAPQMMSQDSRAVVSSNSFIY